MLAAERPSSPAEPALKRVPLHDLHVARGGKIVPFAGYEMPVQYTAGVLKEHLHTRTSAGLFDVSHMGQIVLRAKSGKVEDAARALETLIVQLQFQLLVEIIGHLLMDARAQRGFVGLGDFVHAPLSSQDVMPEVDLCSAPVTSM